MSSHGLRVGNAPVSWGVTVADSPANPPWRSILDEMASSGYEGTELGPPGFMPADPGLLVEEIKNRGLSPIGGTLIENLHEPGRREYIEAEARRVCSLLGSLDAPYLVIIADSTPEREATAGRPDAAQRLEGAELENLVDNLRRCVEVAEESGVTAVVHPHAGTHVEFEDEVARVLERVEDVGLCLDTGHAAYAGDNPLEMYRSFVDSVRYIHLKDVDSCVHERALEEKMSFPAACEAGVFCPLGGGSVDFTGMRDLLRENGYEGWVTVEQDVEPGKGGNPKGDAVKSMDYLKRVGLANKKRGER